MVWYPYLDTSFWKAGVWLMDIVYKLKLTFLHFSAWIMGYFIFLFFIGLLLFCIIFCSNFTPHVHCPVEHFQVLKIDFSLRVASWELLFPAAAVFLSEAPMANWIVNLHSFMLKQWIILNFNNFGNSHCNYIVWIHVTTIFICNWITIQICCVLTQCLCQKCLCKKKRNRGKDLQLSVWIFNHCNESFFLL